MRLSQEAFNGNAIIGSAKLLSAIQRLQASPFGVPVVKNTRGRPRKGATPHTVDFAIVNVQFHVAAHFGLTTLQLLSGRKHSKARQMAMFLARETGASLPSIGRHFGKHHTTILSGIRAVPCSPSLWADIVNVRKKLRSPVESGDMSQTAPNSPSDHGKKYAVNGQEELAA